MSLRSRLFCAISLLMLIAAGCSPDSETVVEEGQDSPTATEADGTGTETEEDASGTGTISVVDDVGRVIDLDGPVDRAVVFNDYNLEFTRAVGAIDRVVGTDDSVTDFPEYWPEFDAEDTASSQGEPNWEKIVSVEPDVVILPRNGAWQESIEQLESFGIKTVVLTGWDVTAHQKNMATLGLMFQERQRAEEANAFYADQQEMLEERLADVTPKPLYWEASSDLETVIPGSGWHDMLLLAGAVNIFEDISIPTAESGAGAATGSVHSFPIEAEQVVRREPQMIVKRASGGPQGTPPDELQALLQDFVDRPLWDDLPAVQNGRVHTITRFAAGTSSKVIGAVYVAKWLHPELFEDVDPDAIAAEWFQEFQDYDYDPSRHRATLEAGTS